MRPAAEAEEPRPAPAAAVPALDWAAMYTKCEQDLCRAEARAETAEARIAELEAQWKQIAALGESFGQCVPQDATMRQRVEAASALLLLDDPQHLFGALFDAGLEVVTEAHKAVLDAMAKAQIHQGLTGAAVFSVASEEGDVCRAELARRETQR